MWTLRPQGFVCLLCFWVLVVTCAQGQIDVWIDTDPSIGLPFRDVDDGFALIQAFRSPEIHVRGISATYGNAALQQTEAIADSLVHRFGGASNVEGLHVFPGAEGAGDLGSPTAATAALEAALIRKPLTYVALGPLTNLATFLKLHPEHAARIDRVVFLGGRMPGEKLYLGNRLPYEFHDANFDKDPLAALVVLHAPVAMELVPLRVSSQVLFTPQDLVRIGRDGGPAGQFLADNTHGWLRSWRWLFGLEGGPAFDCLAVLAVTHPECFECCPARVCVSDHLEAPHPAAFGDPAAKFYLLTIRGNTATPATGRTVLLWSAIKSGAKDHVIDALLGRRMEPPTSQTSITHSDPMP